MSERLLGSEIDTKYSSTNWNFSNLKNTTLEL